MSQVVIHYSFDDPILGQTRVVSGKICGEKNDTILYPPNVWVSVSYTCSLQPITIQESDILTVSLLTSSDQALSFE